MLHLAEVPWRQPCKFIQWSWGNWKLAAVCKSECVVGVEERHTKCRVAAYKIVKIKLRSWNLKATSQTVALGFTQRGTSVKHYCSTGLFFFFFWTMWRGLGKTREEYKTHEQASLVNKLSKKRDGKSGVVL